MLSAARIPSAVRCLTFLLALAMFLGVPTGVQASTITFTNTGTIVIPTLGAASPYPSEIVAAISGPVTNVTASIIGFSHSSITDVDILLVAPDNTRVQLMSFVGTGAVSNVNYTFTDGNPSMPFIGAPPSGTYAPTPFHFVAYPAPAPGLPYGTTMSAFNGIDPNGTWSLYVVDRFSGDAGSIRSGWELTITTSEVPEPSTLMLIGLGAALLVARRRTALRR